MTNQVRVTLLGLPRALFGVGGVDFMPDMRYRCLAYLAVAEDWVRRDDLIYLFWPDTSQDKAREKLRYLLHRVRRLGWTVDLETNLYRVRWAVETDVNVFEAATRARDWERAVALYTGPFLAGLDGGPPEFSQWLELERTRFHGSWREAVLSRVGELEETGQV